MYRKWTEEEKFLIWQWTEEGWGLKEIANELEISVDNVKKLRAQMGSSTKSNYKHLYKGTVKEVQDRLIKLMQDSPLISYAYFNSKDSLVPSATTYRKYFGTWENALKAAGCVTTEGKCSTKHDKPTILYLVEFDDFYKIGITQQTVQQRLGGRYPKYNILIQMEMSLEEAKSTEKQWLDQVKPFQFIPTNFPAEGRGFTECFKY